MEIYRWKQGYTRGQFKNEYIGKVNPTLFEKKITKLSRLELRERRCCGTLFAILVLISCQLDGRIRAQIYRLVMIYNSYTA